MGLTLTHCGKLLFYSALSIYFFQCIIECAYLAVVENLIISGIALRIIPTYVTKHEAVTTNMPVKAVLWSAFLFLLKNFLSLDKKKSLRMFLLK